MHELQLAINAVALGAAYALVALGFVLVLNATGAVNFAQGDLVMVGGFCAVVLAAALRVPGIVLLPIVAVLMAAFGVLFALVAYFPLKHRPPVTIFISTIAMGIVLQNAANGVFGSAPQPVPPLFSGGVVRAGALEIGRQSLAIIATAALLIAGQQALFARTQLGRRLRATAQDREMARAVGIPVDRMIALTFAVATALAGAVGVLLGNQFFVSPTDGTNLIVKAYIAVTIGGWGSVPGAVVGALIIAFFEVFLSAYVSYTAAAACLYVTLLAVLMLRPQGIFGEPVRRRA